ncbi:MAG: hypothetical protein RSC26_15715 [Terrisporobacter sp.]
MKNISRLLNLINNIINCDRYEIERCIVNLHDGEIHVESEKIWVLDL